MYGSDRFDSCRLTIIGATAQFAIDLSALERDAHPCAKRDASCVALDPIRRLPCDCVRAMPERVAESAETRGRAAGFEPARLRDASLPYERMRALYNEYQGVVVDPVLFHASGRAVVEAMACGRRVLTRLD
jgi:hypothetical protein